MFEIKHVISCLVSYYVFWIAVSLPEIQCVWVHGASENIWTQKGKRNFRMEEVSSSDLPDKEVAGRNVRLLEYENAQKKLGSKIWHKRDCFGNFRVAGKKY